MKTFAGTIAIATVALLLPAASAGTTAHAAAAAQPAATKAAHHPDFNRDGYADVVIGSPGDDVAGTNGAGGTWVLYGGPHGANTGNRHQYFTEASIGRGATSGAIDSFGWAWAAGDFNGDGYDDLASSAIGKTVNGHDHAGAVVVLYGSPFGLHTSNAQFFTEDTSGMGASSAASEYFGTAVAAGDFNRDGRADLAIGAYGEDVGGVHDSGRVFELFGTASGLSHSAPLLPKHFDESTAGIHGGVKLLDDFGNTLQNGDFNGDGYADLAVGAPWKRVGGQQYAGAVDVLFGSPSGLTGRGAQTWTEDSSGVPDTSEEDDMFGYTLGALDINGDGRDELVIGAPSEDLGATSGVGAATVLYGSSHGPTTDGVLFWLLSNTTQGQSPEEFDYFGSSFAPFDFDGDGRMDLAIGVEGQDILSSSHAGEVIVLHNVGGRLSRSGAFQFDRGAPGLLGPAAPGENFGAKVRAGDWSGNGRDDLAVSVPYMTVSGKTNAGAVQVFYGAAFGLADNDQLFTANALGGTPYQDANMGSYDW